MFSCRLPFTFMALQGCCQPLSKVKHLEEGKLQARFEEEILGYFRQRVLEPLCRDIETELRLQAHSHLKLDDDNPLMKESGLQDSNHLLKLQPMYFSGRF